MGQRNMMLKGSLISLLLLLPKCLCGLLENVLLVQDYLLDKNTKGECKMVCQENPDCTFWTFSSLSTGIQCGIRTYSTNFILESPGQATQSYGFKNGDEGEGGVPIFKGSDLAGSRLYLCQKECIETSDCFSWIWSPQTKICSLNKYEPQCKIDLNRAGQVRVGFYSGVVRKNLNIEACSASNNP